jgi:hypothetical protein
MEINGFYIIFFIFLTVTCLLYTLNSCLASVILLESVLLEVMYMSLNGTFIG